ncbi:hypothetical protein ACWOAH_09825 [Vagococcus vulneris]|uniref:Excisionase n=1 Tax=Vagococcus vulneris TaxID=1977869 RepID=A0A429ZWU2_9ENTE|nr:hypothetical protein [Vagococcus vulneris]RST98285.1 hypothetical protein CBF37_08215 [Vagococcus vulneris]
MTVRPWLSKEQFMKKYAKSDSTYAKRTEELRKHPIYSEAYIAPTTQEVWIDESIYQEFLIWKHQNKFK